MQVETVRIEQLNEDPSNVRKHGQRNLEAIKASLAKFGQPKPIVVGRDNVIVAGNGTMRAAQALGWESIDVVYTELEGADRTAFAIADNRTAELAEWDEGLADLLSELQADESIDHLATGFDDSEIDQLIAGGKNGSGGGEVQQDEPPDPASQAISQTGDLWLMPSEQGEHRLLCGDSTSAGDVQTVMGEQTAALMQTDPPYLVEYTGKRANRPNEKTGTGKDWSDSYIEVEQEGAEQFFRLLFKNALRVCQKKAALYCWHAHRNAPVIDTVWNELGILNHQQIIWVKPTPVWGKLCWLLQHEPCVMGWLRGNKPDMYEVPQGQHSVWDCDWGGKAKVSGNEHPTQKPLEIFARPMRKHTREGDVCFEPFAGSGSQLIAAHQLGRLCYAIEKQPVFVDVVLRRYLKETGQSPIRESDGARFTDLMEPSDGPARTGADADSDT